MNQIIGMDKLTAQLKEIAKINGVDELFNAVEKEVFPIIQELTPVDTGALLESERLEKDETTVYFIAGNDEDVDYAVDVEIRTPYVRPALDNSENAVVRETANGLNKKLRKIANG